MAKKPAKTKAKAKAKKSVGSKPKAKSSLSKAKPVKKAAPKAKAPLKSAGKSADKNLKKTTAKTSAKAPLKTSAKVTPAKGAQEKLTLKLADKDPKIKKMPVPSVMGSKPKKDADELDDEFLDDDIEIDPDIAEFVEDVAELEQADAEAEKVLAEGASGGDDEAEAAAPTKKSPKEKSASERRIKKERDLLSGIDRNGDMSEIWQKFYDTHKSEKAKSYNMRETFEAKSALQHVKLGWGFILSNINDRLEVLFKEGIKILISNYKS